MAGRGPAPKAERSRPNDTARREAETTVLVETGELFGPDLPESDWHELTVAWWETWRHSPQAATFGSTDWDFLRETALLHSEFWNGNHSLAAELRLRVGKFGATPEDRQRLKIKFAPADSKPAGATPKRRAKGAHRLSLVQD